VLTITTATGHENVPAEQQLRAGSSPMPIMRPHRNAARRIGPLAACSAHLQLVLLRVIGDAIGDGTEESVELQLPGINATALNALLGAGFRTDHVGLFMSSRTFGRFDRYLPCDGTLL